MIRIIVASARPQNLTAFTAALSSNPEVELQSVGSGAETLDVVRASAPHLVVIDSSLVDVEPLKLARQLLMVNAAVNTAVISHLSAAEFHEASEGLGILCSLPERPGAGDTATLLVKLDRVLGVMG